MGLTLQSPVETKCTTRFTKNLSKLPTQCIYELRMGFTINKIVSLYSTHGLIFLMDVRCILSELGSKYREVNYFI
jgi:hypothetical protein